MTVLVAGVSVCKSISNARAIDSARKAYRAALAELEVAPASERIKQETLALGRKYSALARSKRGITASDEVALMSDVDDACASASKTGQARPGNSIHRLQNQPKAGFVYCGS